LAQTGANIFGHNSLADGARELFKPSKDAESHVVSISKNWEALDLNVFESDVTIGVGLSILGGVNGPWAPQSRGCEAATQTFHDR